MKDFVIITDSGCDLPLEMIETLDIKVVTMALTIAGKLYRHFHDCRELSMEDFYKLIREGHIGTTSCVSVGDASTEMKEWLDKGYDVLYLSFSSGMSGSYQSANIAAESLKEEYPDSKIIVVDTLSGSIGLGMLAYLAAKYKNGHTIEETSEYICSICLNICHYFMVDDLKFIQKTGRVSAMSAIFGTALGIKPLFRLSDEGKVDLVDKIRGKKTGIRRLTTLATEDSTKSDIFFICHADAFESAEKLSNGIKEKYPDAQVVINQVGPILGNNTGPGALAVIFYGANR